MHIYIWSDFWSFDMFLRKSDFFLSRQLAVDFRAVYMIFNNLGL